ncbi:hypothetical protein [Caballeronia sp. SL2Y3]|uniref:hypothetical protein n=1 Tax=Caballeronia sp. SL2Y3 TaxID=2878151 RepID=UPI001FD5A5D8|nr:hypothetical protein [Caballeronia sp. SL2Y3]
MTRSNLRVFIGALLLVLVALDASADDGRRGEGHHHAQQSGRARLYDARGDVVGDVVYISGSDYAAGVVLNVKGVFVFAGFSSSETSPTGGRAVSNEWIWQYPRLAYSGKNCSGTPYVFYEQGAFRPSAIERRGTTATLFIARDTTSEAVPVGSYESGDAPPRCFDGTPRRYDGAWPVESTIDLTQLYPEPLRTGR